MIMCCDGEFCYGVMQYLACLQDIKPQEFPAGSKVPLASLVPKVARATQNTCYKGSWILQSIIVAASRALHGRRTVCNKAALNKSTNISNCALFGGLQEYNEWMVKDNTRASSVRPG